jgi:threonine dehydratase
VNSEFSVSSVFKVFGPACETRSRSLRCNNILDAIGHTPLVRLNRLTAGFAAEVYVKVDYMNPGGSVKDRIGISMIDARAC